MKNQYAKNKDKNHNEIKEALITGGYCVEDMSFVGRGYFDLLVTSKTDIPVWIEIKSDHDGLNENEQKFFDRYRGPKGIAWTPEQALTIMEYWDCKEIK